MTRIVPPSSENYKRKLPNWMNPKAVIEASKSFIGKVASMTKEASKPEEIIASYICPNCNKSFQSSHTDFIKQATIASKNKVEFKPTCPNCGKEVIADKKIPIMNRVSNLQTLTNEKRVDLRDSHNHSIGVSLGKIGSFNKIAALEKEASGKGTYNTYVDRHIMYRAVDELGKYARKSGMTNARARYLRSEHVKEAGADIQTLNNIECVLEWVFGRNQKGYATSTISIDSGGKFVFPTIFKVASGKEFPFTERSIRSIEREPVMFNSYPSRKKSDVPTFKKVDPSNFRAASLGKVGEYKNENEK
jgi:DNA-directed RNA polymerase subunit RPC12/RpoP